MFSCIRSLLLIHIASDCILDYAIEYVSSGIYPNGLTKDKKRAVRKRAKMISVEQGEIFLKKRKGKVKLYNYIG